MRYRRQRNALIDCSPCSSHLCVETRVCGPHCIRDVELHRSAWEDNANNHLNAYADGEEKRTTVRAHMPTTLHAYAHRRIHALINNDTHAGTHTHTPRHARIHTHAWSACMPFGIGLTFAFRCDDALLLTFFALQATARAVGDSGDSLKRPLFKATSRRRTRATSANVQKHM